MPSTTSFADVLPFYLVCPYCGKDLKRITIEVLGRKREVGCWASCGCADALADDAGVDSWQREYVKAGIPKGYLDADCETMRNEVEVANGRSLYIVGPNGAGKTYYAATIAKRLLDMQGRNLSVYFTTSVDLIDAVRDTYDGQDNGALDRACGCDVLVLDDLGKETPTRNNLEILFILVNYRNSERKPIVITSNFTRGELADRWDAVDGSMSSSIVSRLCENSGIVEIRGMDRRIS